MIDPKAIDRLVYNLAPLLPNIAATARAGGNLWISGDLGELDDQDLATLLRIQTGEAVG